MPIAGLSRRDRSLITITALVAMYRPDQLKEQLILGLDNGLTREEIGETLTHLAFYAAWPSANSAAGTPRPTSRCQWSVRNQTASAGRRQTSSTVLRRSRSPRRPFRLRGHAKSDCMLRN